MLRLFLLPASLTIAFGLLGSGTAHAQSRTVYIPPDVKALKAAQIRQEALRAQSAASSSRTSTQPTTRIAQTPTNVQIAVNIPGDWNPPASVAIRGPEGDVRTFAVEGGRAAYASRVIVLHPGERITIQLTPKRSNPPR